MKQERPCDEAVREHVDRRVRRRVGQKVLGDLGRWADDVEREQRERPRLVLLLLAVVAVIAVGVILILR